MAGFAAEVWVLCVIAFLLGSGVTWLLFVRPLRARPTAPAPADADPGPAPAPGATVPAAPVRPPAPPAVDPALTALDGVRNRTPHPGRRAAGALDLLGVSPEQDGPRPR